MLAVSQLSIACLVDVCLGELFYHCERCKVCVFQTVRCILHRTVVQLTAGSLRLGAEKYVFSLHLVGAVGCRAPLCVLL